MLIFAFLSVPLYVLMVKNKIEFKDITLFFVGIVISSIVSIIFWAFGSLYVLQTNSIIVKTIKDYLVYILPIILLIGVYVFDAKNSLKLNNFYFFSGFIYWNLLFKLLANFELSNDVLSIYLPIHYLFILFVLQHLYLYKLKNIKYINYYFFSGLIVYLFVILLMNFYSIILFSIFSFFVILFFVSMIFNIHGLRDFFYDKKSS